MMATINYDDYVQCQLRWVRSLLATSKIRPDLAGGKAEEYTDCALRAFNRLAVLPKGNSE
ncbi:hypothetical protein [Aestuariispira insulae]|uniref:Uncharacterized protein n=1 Tax=Aestuariispira insulae TaxID=1461337 RepID=A0A3D9HK07_9PROT|nr:hypothetical protein [Aestuariispira insulae]RED49837.1 hypothetical protein DFP90_105209 [Aestuariispira insulae]